MLTPSRFVPDVMETPEQFGQRIRATRLMSRRASGVLRAMSDAGDYSGLTADQATGLADMASMFPEDAVGLLPETAAPSREAMVSKMLEPYATYRREAARAPVYAQIAADSELRSSSVLSVLADRVGVMPSDIADSRAGNSSSGSYTEAMYDFYR